MNSLTKAGIVLGLGLGGFVDGIVLHQILGWHHLICTTETCQVETVAALKVQNMQDGFFHLAMWTITVLGVCLLFRSAGSSSHCWSGKSLVGAALLGWGLFNFFEGLANHQILGVHHVLPGHPYELLFDMLFLLSGVLLAAAGAWMISTPRTPRNK
jgi:uncharacterized membrane protein